METPSERSGSTRRLDADAVAALYRDHAEDLRCFLLGVLGNLDLANEVLQNTFAKTVEQGHTAAAETIKSWLYRVAFNEAMTLRRRQGVRTRAAKKLSEGPIPVGDPPEELFSRGETVAEVRAAVKHLPQEQQKIIQLRMYEEKTFAAIATELKLPLGTVYARMQQALKTLKQKLS